MDLTELANQIDTFDVIIGVVVGLVVWVIVNAIGVQVVAKLARKSSDELEPNWSIASAHAGLRLIATLSGIGIGVLTVWFIAI